MKCIVGLGNPGSRYRLTRHNVGFLVAESMIDDFKAHHYKSNELFESYHAQSGESEVLIVMPQTYMNNSGVAVRELHQQLNIGFDEFLILFDDFQLPFGTLRMRTKGSDGGHNGMASVIYHVQSELIPRLRIGIGGKTMPEGHTRDEMADFVLSLFDSDEEKLRPQLLRHAADACKSWVHAGIAATMSGFNKKFFSDATAS